MPTIRADADDAATLPVTPPRFFNRELSWLDFNERVLDLARDNALPLLERVKFLAIFASNLDEFFMKRIGGLHRQRADDVRERSLDGLTVDQQLALVHARVRSLIGQQVALWFDELHPALKKERIAIRRYVDLSPAQRQFCDELFRRQMFPILTPLAVDPGHPFPFISNLSKSMGVLVEPLAASPDAPPERSFVRIKVPENLPRWIAVPADADATADARTFVPLEGVIGANLPSLFPGMGVVEHRLFRVTRNADVEADEEDADDLLAMITAELRLRRMADVVRLELPEAMSPAMRAIIVEGTEVAADDVYLLPGPIDMDDLMQLASVDRPDLKFAPWKPLTPTRLRDDELDVFTAIRAGDIFVHHPYESFAASVERFVEAAALDPRVLAIKMTLYRTSLDSPFVPALIRAAESGKQVAVLVELKARFDEQRNVELARRLENAGVHVVYGIVGLKTHTKLAIVVRDEPDGLRTYCHIGTGNYNSRTAQLYVDVGLFTCDPAIAGDVTELFHYLTGRSLKKDYARLLVAPVTMRDRFLALIDREIAHATARRSARIIAKMNALQDRAIIERLYDASNAGVDVDLIVRGFCCLVPGVRGQSERIRVTSTLGRFLEHSRIYWFDNDGASEVYIGSADWMSRNLDARVEAIAPVGDAAIRATLRGILDTMLADHGHVWELRADGSWNRRARPAGSTEVDAQEQFMRQALAGQAAK